MIDSRNGIVGLAIGDALGVPVEYCHREILIENPVVTMKGYGSHYVPKGSWSDDTSMTLATVESIARLGRVEAADIANNFLNRVNKAEFTARIDEELLKRPGGTAFSEGGYQPSKMSMELLNELLQRLF